MPPNARPTVMTLWVVVMTVALVGACASEAEKAAKLEAAMVAQAKLDMEAESLFVADSLRVVASITLDTVADMEVRTSLYNDETGDMVSERTYLALARSRAQCMLDSARYQRTVRGDTLTCQWEAPK